MKPTVVITAELPEIATAILSQECDVVTHPSEATRTEDEMIAILAEADAAVTMLSDPLTRRVLESNVNLRAIANYAVGINNIDLEAAREFAITVTNTPGVLTDATADLTFALILSVARHVLPGDRMVRAGEFRGWHPLMLLGTSLTGKQLGIVGMGRIGHAVARRAAGFGMPVVYVSRSPKSSAEEELGARHVDIEELLKTSDFVSLHVPLTNETHHMIDADALALMKPSAYLINTARGAVVDEEALAKALHAGRLRGAGLDVYEREPEVDPRLLTLENVVLLPHLGTGTEETRHEMARMVAYDILAALQGGRPKHVV